MKLNIIHLVVLSLAAVGLFIPRQTLAHFSQASNTKPCLQCHTNAGTSAASKFIYVAINGAEMATPSVSIPSSTGGSFQIDWYFTGMMRGVSSGALLKLPATTWSAAPGTLNGPTGTNFTANWNTNWDRADGLNALWPFTDNLHYSVKYTGTTWDADGTGGGKNNDTACDNGGTCITGPPAFTDQDGGGSKMGTDMIVTVPAGYAPGTYIVTVYGIGTGDSGTKGYIQKDISVTVTSAANNPPAAPTSPAQFQSDGTTAIALGGYATSTTVVFKGNLSDPDANTVKLQIDLNNDGLSDCESSLVASGSSAVPASCTVVNGNSYDWRYQAVDSVGAASGWTAFNAATPDFRVDTTAPSVSSTTPTSGATGVALNGTVTINFSENIACATVNTTNITSTGGWALNTCSGSTATFTTSAQANSTTYNVSVTSAVTDLAGNALSPAPYNFSYTTTSGANNPPATPGALAQYKSDGTTPVTAGTYTNSTSPVMKGTITDPDGNTVQLEVEIQPVASAFTNTPNCTSGSLVASGSTSQATCSSLADGRYKWQARSKDSVGATSAWVQY